MHIPALSVPTHKCVFLQIWVKKKQLRNVRYICVIKSHVSQATKKIPTSAQIPPAGYAAHKPCASWSWDPPASSPGTVHSWWVAQTCCWTPSCCRGSWDAQSPPCTSTPSGCSAAGNLSAPRDACPQQSTHSTVTFKDDRWNTKECDKEGGTNTLLATPVHDKACTKQLPLKTTGETQTSVKKKGEQTH